MGWRREGFGFTLIDVMIVVVLLGILASVVVPIVTGHLDRAKSAAASTTQAMVRKALDMYFERYNRWPASLSAELFQPAEEVTMPRGYQLLYDPDSGELDLVLVPEEELDGAPAVAVVE